MTCVCSVNVYSSSFRLSAVAGTEEPIYGPEAIQPVGKNAGEPAFTELTKENLKWQALNYTNVETQTFYFNSDAGHIGFLQVIYNNIAGLRTTVQFNTKLFYPNNEKPFLWSSDALSNYGFDEGHYSFHADGVSIQLNEDGSAYTIKAAVNNSSLVNVTFTRTAPGFQGGKNGTSNYGTDPKEPWGSMHHHFWPRCSVAGSVITREGEIKIDGRGMLSHALQGMKPHHAGKWSSFNLRNTRTNSLQLLVGTLSTSSRPRTPPFLWSLLLPRLTDRPLFELVALLQTASC
jgi:hypothetical protein